jgi:2-methylaconitate cis-trans-isomerase PrpF
MLRSLPAVFARGGTSKGLLFHARDLPVRAEWDALFLAAIGSPDPYGRQLNGMGGGVSSLSKVCIVGPSSRPDADVDYTFGQVVVAEARVDYTGNCGNMSSAIGPFAVDEGLVPGCDGEHTVRIHNTNTGKIIRSTFRVEDGRAATEGELEIPGVSGTGAPVRLDFVEPGGATTGKLLPTGRVREMLAVPGVGDIEVSMVDAANASVFVRARDLGLTGAETPQALETNAAALHVLADVRLQASVAMGIARSLDAARERPAVPYIGIVAPPRGEAEFTARVIATGQPHRALPLTVSLCLAVAARIEGTVVHDAARPASGELIRIEMPSGVISVGARVERTPEGWYAAHGSFYRTQRRLFDGRVYC